MSPGGSKAEPTQPRDRQPSTPRASSAATWMALTGLTLACALPLVWPGDVPFINDEPQLIASAAQANADRRLATMGLLGTYGVSYGPAPTWVYQLLLAVSDDLVLVAGLHALLMTTVTAGALWWLGRSLRLWIGFVSIPLLSPYFWFYARVLWDNTFLLPLGALAIAGYAAHLEHESSLGLRVAVTSMLLIPLVHLMGLALILPLGAHLVLVRGRSLWRHKISLAAIASFVFWLASPYWQYLVSARPPASTSEVVASGWLFPLSGGRLLSADGLAYFYGPGPVSGTMFGLAAAASSLAYPLVWAGMVVALAALARATHARAWTPREHMAAIALAALLCQSALDGLSGRFQHPHYHNGTWIAFVLLAWMAVDTCATRLGTLRRCAHAVTGLLVVSLAASVTGLAVGLHRTGGTREVYGPTLANQQTIAKRLADFAPTSDVQIQVSMWERFPHTPAILRALHRSRRIDLPRRDFAVRYASDDPASGAIALVEP
jgi:hypothetical protein